MTLLLVLGLLAGDYELVVPGLPGPICAKSAQTCAKAQEAIREGKWPIAPKDAPTRCQAHPGCFPERSNCIENFNCGRTQ